MRYKTKAKKRLNKTEWHVWFAWYPVYVLDQTVWLEFVGRKGICHYSYADDWWEWEYQLIE